MLTCRHNEWQWCGSDPTLILGQVKHLGTATVSGEVQRRAIAFVLGTHAHDVNLPTAPPPADAAAAATAASEPAAAAAAAASETDEPGTEAANLAGGSTHSSPSDRTAATMANIAGASYVAELCSPVQTFSPLDVCQINTSYEKFTFPTEVAV
eukprot:gene12614-28060_t